MKTVLFITALFCLIQTTLASNNDSTTLNTPSNYVESITKLHALKYEKTIYFNLAIENEAEDAWYIVVKECNGEEQVIGMKQGHCNLLNTPLSYSFKDSDIGMCEAFYSLVKITDAGQEELASWHYSEKTFSMKRAELPLINNLDESIAQTK